MSLHGNAKYVAEFTHSCILEWNHHKWVVTMCFNNNMMLITIHCRQYDTRSIWAHLERYDVIQWPETAIVIKRKCLFLCNGRGGKTLEKLDTLNYTNTQTENLPSSVLLVLLPWSAIIWSDAAEATHTPRTSEDELEKGLQLFTILSVKNTSR